MDNEKLNTTEIAVRYNEVDKQGIVHNSVYYIWFEISRWEFAKKVLHITEEELEQNDIYVIVYESNCTYFNPARFNDTLRVEVLFKKTESPRFILYYKITRPFDNKIIVKGSTTHAFIRRNGTLLLHMPDFFAEKLDHAYKKYSQFCI